MGFGSKSFLGPELLFLATLAGFVAGAAALVLPRAGVHGVTFVLALAGVYVGSVLVIGLLLRLLFSVGDIWQWIRDRSSR